MAKLRNQLFSILVFVFFRGQYTKFYFGVAGTPICLVKVGAPVQNLRHDTGKDGEGAHEPMELRPKLEWEDRDT